jgi:hypothetical protein
MNFVWGESIAISPKERGGLTLARAVRRSSSRSPRGPHHHEERIIPPDIVARIISKGSLFSVDLNLVCTMLTQAFPGNLGRFPQTTSSSMLWLIMLDLGVCA